MTRIYLTNLSYIQLLIFSILNFGVSTIAVPAQLSSADSAEMQKCRQFDFTGTMILYTASDSRNIYVATEDGMIHAIESLTFQKVWSSNIGGQIVSNLIAANGRVIVVTNAVLANGSHPLFSTMRSLSSETGLTDLNLSLPYSSHFYLGLSGGTIVSVGKERVITANAAENGNLLWKNSFSGIVTAPPAFEYDRIIFGTDQKDVFGVSPTNGQITLRTKTRYNTTVVSNISANTIALGDERGNLNLLDVFSGKTIWKFKSGAKISSASQTGEGVLASSNDNFVYLMSAYNGSIIWKRRLPGRVAGKPLVTGEIVVVPINADKAIYLLDLNTGKIVNQLAGDEINSSVINAELTKDDSLVFAANGTIISYNRKECQGK